MDRTAYFDNAATTFPKPEMVYEFTNKFYRECGVNVGRGQHKLSSNANSLMLETRILLLDLNNCRNKKVVFTHSATEALNIILQGLPIRDGWTIYLSPFEHNAVTRVIAHLQQIYKLNVVTLSVNKETLKYDLNRIKYQFLEDKPNLVVVSHASNVCGVIAPVHDLSAMAKNYGAITVIDMCQSMGLIDTDLSSQNIDFAVFAGHKTLYGPLGIAGFICSGDIKLAPLIFGGTGIDSINESMPDTVPERYEAGSPNIMAIAGLNAALKWINGVGIKQIYEKEKNNHLRLLAILGGFENIRIIIPSDINNSVGVVSSIFDRYSSDNIGNILSNRNIAVRSGLHCSPSAHKFLGTFPSGTTRFSVSYFNTDSDFDELESALNYIQEFD